ncbi:hypothetical protein ASG01_13110 [Chryseobacterium sp. Leaf180]|uniref:hypothetical protein n=1 Tax=Chryseobacterium sp. Leaf180 TaxID=1736289 RepID=UPI0006FCDD22|nr:hypothetical protein [Chryseobacterium sp. Leaf180]KQR91936.1 hypothetical protein ASG01_13110 [Chryseobacterium sp. Leaf180]
MKKIITMFAVVLITISVGAQEKQTVKEAVKQDAKVVGNVAKKGAVATKKGVQKGAEWTGETAKKGAKATEKGVKNGVKWTEKTAQKGAKAIEKTYQEVKTDIKK